MYSFTHFSTLVNCFLNVRYNVGLAPHDSLRDFIVLVLNIEVFQIKFFLKIKSLKKKKKKKSSPLYPPPFPNPWMRQSHLGNPLAVGLISARVSGLIDWSQVHQSQIDGTIWQRCGNRVIYSIIYLYIKLISYLQSSIR